MEVIIAEFLTICKVFIFFIPVYSFVFGFVMGSVYNEPRRDVSPYSWVLIKVYLGLYNLGTDIGRNSVKLNGDDKNDDI